MSETKAYIPEWLDKNIFNNILEENVAHFKKIKNFTVEPALKCGENFMTLLLNVKIDVELKDDTTKTVAFMSKVLPDIEKMQNFLKDWKVFEKELKTYTCYIPAFEAMYKEAGLPIKFGAKVFATKEPKVPKEHVLMEDLREKGFKNIKRQEGLDMEHTKRTLEKLAQFHAASACYFELKGNYPDMYKQCLCSEVDYFEDYRKATAKLLTDLLPLYGAEYLKEKLTNYVTIAPDPFQVEAAMDASEFNVLNHGDCWSNNIMFKYNDDSSIADVYFVDFQMCRYGSPAQDLSYLLISSTKLENKIKKFDYFISYYHEKLLHSLSLLKYPKTLPTLREIHIALLKHGDWAYTITTTVMPVLLLDPTEKANMDSVIDEGEKGDELKRLMFKNTRYVDHMKKLLPWMDNRGLFVY